MFAEDNGLYYMRARYYDAQVGRFISEDPIGMAGGLNLYAYVGGNPIILVDPSGLEAEFSNGVSSYFEGIGGTICFAARRSGLLGGNEQNSATIEGQVFAELANQLITNPEAREIAVDSSDEYAKQNSYRVAGRASIIIGVGILSSRAGVLGVGLATTLNAAAVNGNIRNAIRNGAQSVEGLAAPVIGGTR